ncbi:response regulator [Cytophagales bacterium LB-30]|uniref:Response regulator n=1 Tax=Shiella aurantiaca TaxID=3058365 RepID=A0ABT8F989_9BACT|nr:response regulator [Shiella aurantiaca]MDN4166863.1 response regulator [Shiella aurantiaca]
MSEAKKILLIDDEPLARNLVLEYLQDFPQLQVVAECGNGYEGLKAIQEHQPDLIFLDIQMPKINGFEMLELVETPPAVIFTTAFDEFALQAFEAHAVDYLLKPFSQERFAKSVQKWLSQPQAQPAAVKQLLQETPVNPENKNRIVVKEGSVIKIIALPEVMYFEAYDDYVKIHTSQGFFLKKTTMASLENMLNAQEFVRVHRSYLLNVAYLTRIEPYDKDTQLALLKNGNRLNVSRAGYAKIKEVLGL